MTDQEIATTILQQLGGNKFLAMTGARNLLSLGNGLSLKFPSANKINYLKITLNSLDTYNMEFGYLRGANYKVKSDLEGVYSDQLQEIFTSKTGLYTSL